MTSIAQVSFGARVSHASGVPNVNVRVLVLGYAASRRAAVCRVVGEVWAIVSRAITVDL